MKNIFHHLFKTNQTKDQVVRNEADKKIEVDKLPYHPYDPTIDNVDPGLHMFGGYRLKVDALKSKPLYLACIQLNEEETVKRLLKAGSDVNELNDDGETPLHCAIYSNSLKTILMLLEYGADINARDKNGNTPLHIAIKICSGSNKYSKFLIHELIQNGANTEVTNEKGISPTDMIINSEDIEAKLSFSEGLLDRAEAKIEKKDLNGAFDDYSLNLKVSAKMEIDWSRGSLARILLKIITKDVTAYERLLNVEECFLNSNKLHKHIYNDSSKTKDFNQESKSIFQKIKNNTIHSLDLSYYDINENDAENLINALSQNESLTAISLTHNDLKVETKYKLYEIVRKNELKQVIRDLIAGNNLKLLNILESNGVDLDNVIPEIPDLMHLAISKDHINLVPYLISKCANVNPINIDFNVRDTNGNTLLHILTKIHEIDTLKILLNKSGINVNAVNKDGDTALNQALKLNPISYEIIQALLDAEGVDVNIPDNDGNTPLHNAVMCGNVNIIEQLSEKGHIDPDNSNIIKRLLEKDDIDIYAVNKDGITSFALIGQTELLSLFIKRFQKDGIKLKFFNQGINTSNTCVTTKRDRCHAITDWHILQKLIKSHAVTSIDLSNSQIDYKSLLELINNLKIDWHVTEIKLNENICTSIILSRINEILNRNQKIDVLYSTIYRSDIDSLKHLSNDDINAKYDSISPPLHLACEIGNLEIVKALIEKGAYINDTRFDGLTPLYLAVLNGHNEVADFLLSRGAGIDIVGDLTKNKTQLHYAVESNKTNVAKFFLDKGCDVNASQNHIFNTAVHIAAGNNNPNMLLLLSWYGAQINNSENSVQFTPLHVAALSGHTNAVRSLLSLNANVNAKGKHGFTPLHLAILKNHIEVIKLLLDATPDDSKEFSIIHLAVKEGNIEVLKLLSDHGFSLEGYGFDGWTHLHGAVEAKQTDMIRFLLDRNVNVNAPTIQGQTPLHMAARNDDEETIQALIEHGAKLEQADDHGLTALHVAAINNNKKAIASLLAVVNATNDVINAKNNDGLSALYFAVRNGDIEMIELLLFHGANDFEDSNMLDRYKTLFDKSHKHMEVIQCIATFYFSLGNQEKAAGNFDIAIRYYNIVLQILPNYVKAYAERGHCKETLHDLPGAIADYENALQFDPKNSILLNLHEVAKKRISNPEWHWKRLLRDIRHNNNMLVSVNYRNRNLNDKLIQRLSNALNKNTSVKTIDLSKNVFTDIGLKSLCKSLASHSLIEELNLIDNTIGDTGVKELCEFIKNNSSLRKLKLGYSSEQLPANHFLSFFQKQGTTCMSRDTITSLINALKDNHTLTDLSLMNTRLSKDDVNEFQIVFANNYTLTHVEGDLDTPEIQVFIKRNKALLRLINAIKNNNETLINGLLNPKIAGGSAASWAIKIAFDQGNHEIIKKIISNYVNLDDIDTKSDIKLICKRNHFEEIQGSKNTPPLVKDHVITNISNNCDADPKSQKRLTEIDPELKEVILNLNTKFHEISANDDLHKLDFIPPDVGVTRSSLQRLPYLDAIKEFLNYENNQLSLLILGEAGLGKTLLAKRIESIYWHDWENEKYNRVIIPIRIPLASIANPKDREHNLLETHLLKALGLRSKVEILKQNCQTQQCRLLIILDGYDEMLNKPSQSLYISNEWLKDWGSPKVITLSRPEAFRHNPNYQLLFYTQNDNPLTYGELYLKPLTPEQIKFYIKAHKQDFVLDYKNYKRVFSLKPFSELAQNPFILSLLVKILPKIGYDLIISYDEKPKELDNDKVYLYWSNDKLNLICKNKEYEVTQTDDVKYLIDDDIEPVLSLEQIEHIRNVLTDPAKQAQLSENVKEKIINFCAQNRCPPKLKNLKLYNDIPYTREEVYTAFISDWLDVQTERILSEPNNKKLFQIVTGVSDEALPLLCRKVLDIYCHNLAKWAWDAGNGQLNVVIQDQDTLRNGLLNDLILNGKIDFDKKNEKGELYITKFLEIIRSGCLLNYNENTWQFSHKSIMEYFAARELFHGAFAAANDIIQDKDLEIPADLSLNKKLLINEPSVINLLADLVCTVPKFKRSLYKIIKDSARQSNISTAAANAITILKVSGESFEHKNWQNIDICGADLTEGIFDYVNFKGANLKDVAFDDAWICHSDFSNSFMDNILINTQKPKNFPDIAKMKSIRGQIITFNPKSQKFYFSDDDQNSQNFHLVNTVNRRSNINQFTPLEVVKFYSYKPDDLEVVSNNLLDDKFNSKVRLTKVFDIQSKSPLLKSYLWSVQPPFGNKEYLFESSINATQFFAGANQDEKSIVLARTYLNKELFSIPKTEFLVLKFQNDNFATSSFNIDNSINHMQFSNDNRLLIIVSDSHFYICDLQSDTTRIIAYGVHLKKYDRVIAACMDRANRYVVTISKQGMVTLWDIINNKSYNNDISWCHVNKLNNKFNNIAFCYKDNKPFLQITDINNSVFYFRINLEHEFHLTLAYRSGPLELNCADTNLNQAINCSVTNEGLFKQTGAHGTIRHLDNDALAKERNISNTKKFHQRNITSLLADKRTITANTWTVSLLRDPYSSHNPSHTYLVIETMDELGEITLYRADFSTKDQPEGKGIVIFEQLPTVKQQDYDKTLQNLCIPADNMNPQRSYSNLKGYTWQISKDKAKQLIASLEAENAKQLDYTVWGSNSKVGNGSDNCYTWAKKKLVALEIKNINTNLPISIADYIGVYPRFHLMSKPQDADKPLSEKISASSGIKFAS